MDEESRNTPKKDPSTRGSWTPSTYASSTATRVSSNAHIDKSERFTTPR